MAVSIEQGHQSGFLLTHGNAEFSIIRQLTRQSQIWNPRIALSEFALFGVFIASAVGVIKPFYDYSQTGEDFNGALLKITLAAAVFRTTSFVQSKVRGWMESRIDASERSWAEYENERKVILN